MDLKPKPYFSFPRVGFCLFWVAQNYISKRSQQRNTQYCPMPFCKRMATGESNVDTWIALTSVLWFMSRRRVDMESGI